MRHGMRNLNNILHFSATNIDFSAKYTSDSRFLASSQLSGDGLARYNLSFNPRYTLLGIISKSIRDTPC